MQPAKLSGGVTVLSADIGGTKTIVSMVRDKEVLEMQTIPTERHAGPKVWLDTLCEISLQWKGQFDCVGVAVTGQVHDGVWSSVNTDTLSIAASFDLASVLTTLGYHFEIRNDAHAAAWAEHVHGVGKGSDLVYLTVSTGLGGGIICNGKLLTGHTGLAGHFGQVSQELKSLSGEIRPFENAVTGRWMAREAKLQGHDVTAKEIFECADSGHGWAQQIVDTSVQRVANICRDISFVIDPPLIVIGGGIGLANGFVEAVSRALSQYSPTVKTTILVPAFREHAGIIGVAAIAAQSYLKSGVSNERR